MIYSAVIPVEPLDQWHSLVADSILAGVGDQTVDQLIDILRLIINADGSCLLIYPKGGQPQCPYRKRDASEDPWKHIEQYLHSAYLLDPFYRLAADAPTQGVYSLKDVAPDGFKQSELYRVYYRLVNFGDEICLIIPVDNELSIQISLSRKDDKPRFNNAEHALITRLFITVQAILLKWWHANKQQNKDTFLDSHLESALRHFGSSVLTQRESQILQLILRGYAAKYIAQKLTISAETIKHHRKNIYAKLDINSQAELFHLFIDSLRMVTPDSPADPLTNYLKPLQT
ncbi:MAG: helix-turn-helix transcriptional regulator [Oceanospirillaceae bacterium]